MVKGNKEKKYKVIHDPFIGSAGAVAIITYFIGMIITISAYTKIDILIASLFNFRSYCKVFNGITRLIFLNQHGKDTTHFLQKI